METIQTYLVDNPKAVVLTIHGSGEHFGRYKHVAEWFNQNQIAMIGGDLPGLGKSKEKRGHVNNFQDYLNKVDEWLKYTQEKLPNTPIFLFGHSMGGLIVLRYMEELKNKNAIKGFIVTSPGISLKLKVPKWEVTMAKVLNNIFPTMKLENGIKSNQVSRSKNIVDKYGTDPLNYSKVSVRWFIEFQNAMKEVWEKADNINKLDIPLIFIQAGEDQLVDANEADKFSKLLNNESFTYLNVPGLYHEILNEPEKETYLKLLTDWISEKA